MDEAQIPERYVDVWKYTTAITISLLIGIVSGQFIPNRSIVTSDQLNAAKVELQEGQIAQQAQISALAQEVADLNGQLKAQRLISK